MIVALAAGCDETIAVTPLPTADTVDAGSTVPNEVDAAGTVDAADAAPACAIPSTFGSKRCDACMSVKCCGVLAACEAASACKALQTCVLACIDEPDAGGCVGGCMNTHADGKADWGKVEECWTGDPKLQRCGDDCT